MWHKATGIVRYDPPRPGMKTKVNGWAVVDTDREITRYYRWQVAKMVNELDLDHYRIHQPAWDAHVSLIRGEKIKPELMHLWKKHQGKKISFEYEHRIQMSYDKSESDTGCFFFVDVHSNDINEIRNELGLRVYPTYHLTIGRVY